MSTSKNAELKFSIQNLINTTTTAAKAPCDKLCNDRLTVGMNRPVKRPAVPLEPSTLARPVPIFKPKLPHPCWSFLSQLPTKSAHAALPLNSSLIFLSKMNQMWEHIQRSQISPSIATTTTNTTETDDASDEDVYMDVSSAALRRGRVEPADEEEEDDELDEDDDDDEDEEEAGECSTSTGDKHNTTSNSEDNDKLKTYPCTQCGKVLWRLSEACSTIVHL